MSLQIKDYMDKDVPTIDDTTSVTEAAKTMSKSGKGFLMVLKAGHPAGIVTENDFVNKVLSRELDPATVSVGEIMSFPIISIEPEEDLLKASEIMRERNIRRLPVIKNGIIYGIIVSKDIAQHCSTYVDKVTKDLIKWSTLFQII